VPPSKKDAQQLIELPRLEYQVIQLPIQGVTPVIPHCWTEKSLRLMRDKQMSEAGTLRKKREPKDPDEEAEQSCYWLDLPGKDGDPVRYGAIPAVAFKASMVAACREFEGITMVSAKVMFHVKGDGDEQLVPLTLLPGSADPAPHVMREDTPRNASGVADLRYRMAFFPWAATLEIKFKASRITAESVTALVDAAGTYGVGDWRPNSPKSDTGTYGQYEIYISKDGEGAA
jgi:hypothetical protein